MKKKPTALVICDGLGYSLQQAYNAVYQAFPATLTMLLEKYPHAFLQASGTAVGLLSNMPGNSLVGHLALGTGRIIKQPITALYEMSTNNTLCAIPVLQKRLSELHTSGKKLHILGLVSDGASHSHIEHLLGLIRCAHAAGIQHIIIHAFLDGRDTPPQSAELYVAQVQQLLDALNCGTIGSITGRAYAMDRVHTVEKTEQTFTMLTTAPIRRFKYGWQEALAYYYKQKITDEFIPPTPLQTFVPIEDEDGVIFFNIRADRARDLATLLYNSKQPHLAWLITGIRYREDLHNDVLFEYPHVKHTLLEVLAEHQQTIFTIAEKEKYAHVTYFFNGGKETKLSTETRHILPSLPAQEFTAHPELSAPEITRYAVQSLEHNPADFYLINYANADMLGHTGNMPATIAAITCLDQQLKILYEHIVEKLDGTLYITSDHGNAELMFDEDTQQPHTAHTTNPVPFIMIRKNLYGKTVPLPLHELRDVAPFILKNYGYKVPEEML